MIVATRDERGTVIEADLATDATAFFDADWLPDEGSAEVQALVARAGALSSGEYEVQIPHGVDAEDAAARALAHVARAAVAAVDGVVQGDVEVIGVGAVAFLARSLLPSRPGLPVEAVIDATGNPATIAAALGRLPELGTLVLAGEMRRCEMDLDLYRDVHVRGLRLVGIANPLQERPAPTDAAELGRPAEAVDGVPVAPTALWFRMSGRAVSSG